MVTVIVLSRVAVFAYLCVPGSCSCSNGTIEGILDKGVDLSCMSTSCGSKQWRNDSMGTSASINVTKHTSLSTVENNYKLHIFGMSAHDVGSYSCWCQPGNDAPAYPICSHSLKLICQAKVVINHDTTLHNSSRTNSFPEITINANLKDRLKVKCPKSAVPSTDCYNVLKKESGPFTYNFKVSWSHNPCRITCQARKETKVVCSIAFTINVSRNKTSTHHLTVSPTVLIVSPPVNETAFTTFSSENIDRVQADTTTEVHEQKNNNLDPVTNKPATVSSMIVVGILVFIVVVLIFVVGFFIFSSRLKFSSQSTKVANPPHSSTGANIPIGPTYAAVNKSSWFVKGEDHSIERGAESTDGFYFEVGGSGKEESLTHQPNSQKVETSTTSNYYSEVHASDAKPKTMENGQETDSTMYSEINKGEKQTRQKECTYSQQSSDDDQSVTNVPIYHVLEESKRPDDDTVDDACTSQALYAVIDKDT